MDCHPNSTAVITLTKNASSVFGRIGRSIASHLGAIPNGVSEAAADMAIRNIGNKLERRYGNTVIASPNFNPRQTAQQMYDVQKLVQHAVGSPEYRVFSSASKPKVTPSETALTSYDPGGMQIDLAGYGLVSPGMAAHEVGHSMYPTTRIGKFIRNARENVDYANSIKGTEPAMKGLQGLSILGEELRASVNGYNYLRQMGYPRRQSLEAFLGVPSYAGALVGRYAGNALLGANAAALGGIGYKLYKLHNQRQAQQAGQ